jgi:peptide-methionine (S)-S-oxide reductase
MLQHGPGRLAAILTVVVAASMTVGVPASAQARPTAPPTRIATRDTVVFAGGCFWGIQAVFARVKGVVGAVSGYAGGRLVNPGYEDVSTGTTGHAESVQIVYDPAMVSYEQLLDVFFTVAHDPTQLNRQGPDVGTQYRSAVFFRNGEQQRATSAYIAKLARSNAFPRPIVTQVTAIGTFYPAEAYHQNYFDTHPNEPYILYNDRPKVEHLRQQFPQLYVGK